MLAIITSYFNPANCEYRLKNYHTFHAALKKIGLPLFTIELSHYDQAFHLTKDDANDIQQIRTNSIMFQKERLLNIVLEKLPPQYDAVCWMDCDLVYLEDDWPIRLEAALQNYVVVQPFQYAVSVPRSNMYLIYDSVICLDNCIGSSLIRRSFAYYTHKTNGRDTHQGHVGYVWAAQREFLNKFKLYDSIITGAGDLFMAMAFFGKPEWFDLFPSIRNLSNEATQHYFDWAFPVSEVVQNKVGFTNDLIMHLWHGDAQQRDYLFKTNFLQQHKFNPNIDLKLADNGCWEWNSDKPELHKAIRTIFDLQHLA